MTFCVGFYCRTCNMLWEKRGLKTNGVDQWKGEDCTVCRNKGLKSHTVWMVHFEQVFKTNKKFKTKLSPSFPGMFLVYLFRIPANAELFYLKFGSSLPARGRPPTDGQSYRGGYCRHPGYRFRGADWSVGDLHARLWQPRADYFSCSWHGDSAHVS